MSFYAVNTKYGYSAYIQLLIVYTLGVLIMSILSTDKPPHEFEEVNTFNLHNQSSLFSLPVERDESPLHGSGA